MMHYAIMYEKAFITQSLWQRGTRLCFGISPVLCRLHDHRRGTKQRSAMRSYHAVYQIHFGFCLIADPLYVPWHWRYVFCGICAGVSGKHHIACTVGSPLSFQRCHYLYVGGWFHPHHRALSQRVGSDKAQDHELPARHDLARIYHSAGKMGRSLYLKCLDAFIQGASKALFEINLRGMLKVSIPRFFLKKNHFTYCIYAQNMV